MYRFPLFTKYGLTALFMLTATGVAAEDGFLGGVEKFFGGAFRAFGGRNAPAQVQVMQQPGVLPTDKEKEQLKSRLEAHSQVFQSWLTRIGELSDEQRASLKELAQKEVEFELNRYATFKDPQRPNRAMTESFPILFTNPNGVGRQFEDRLVAVLRTSLLQEDQQSRLAAALDERMQARQHAFLEYVVSILDKELYLNAQQRKAIFEDTPPGAPRLDHPFYSFQPQTYYLPYQPITALLPAGKASCLNEQQQKRLNDLSDASQNNQHIVFQSNGGSDSWYEQMDKVAADQRAAFMRAVAVRVAYYESELKLSPNQVRHLTIAGKGATTRAEEQWKESTRFTIQHMEQQMARMQGNFAFAAQRMTPDNLDQDAIWAHALASTAPQAPSLKSRKEANRNASVAALVAILDAELWLHPDQRPKLRELVEKTVPRNADPTQYWAYFREIVLLAHPLFKTPDDQLPGRLSEPQIASWKAMKSFFQPQAGNQVLQVQLSNNRGAFGIQLMD